MGGVRVNQIRSWNDVESIWESAILGILCVLLPVVFLGQVIALVYAGGPA
jgi:hypothetical protein